MTGPTAPVGLLAMAWQGRSRGLGIVAVLFAAVPVLANTYNVENPAFRRCGGRPADPVDPMTPAS